MTVYDHVGNDPQPKRKKDQLVALAAIVTILILTGWVLVLKYYSY